MESNVALHMPKLLSQTMLAQVIAKNLILDTTYMLRQFKQVEKVHSVIWHY